MDGVSNKSIFQKHPVASGLATTATTLALTLAACKILSTATPRYASIAFWTGIPVAVVSGPVVWKRLGTQGGQPNQSAAVKASTGTSTTESPPLPPQGEKITVRGKDATIRGGRLSSLLPDEAPEEAVFIDETGSVPGGPSASESHIIFRNLDELTVEQLIAKKDVLRECEIVIENCPKITTSEARKLSKELGGIKIILDGESIQQK